MGLAQFNKWSVNGGALETRGLSNGVQFDPLSLLMFGLIYQADDIWNLCPTVSTAWTLCSTFGAVWTLSPTVTTTWTVIDELN